MVPHGKRSGLSALVHDAVYFEDEFGLSLELIGHELLAGRA
jgi:hypothetical protein